MYTQLTYTDSLLQYLEQLAPWNRYGLYFGVCGLFLLELFFVVRCSLNGLSLTTREFREQSARKRTYIVRSIYALLAFGAAYSVSYEMINRYDPNNFEAMGYGQELFGSLINIQFAGIYLFMPAMTCSLLTSEKERDTLSLLLLTKLKPSGILAGKLLSRLIPMLLFLSVALPLFAFAYSFGGFDLESMNVAIYALIVATFQCAALGLVCSAWFRTTVGAFMGAYLAGAVMVFGLPLLHETTNFMDYVWEVTRHYGFETVFGFDQGAYTGMFFAPLIVESQQSESDFARALLQSVPILSLTIGMLLMSRFLMVRRADAKPMNLMIRLFRLLDRMFWSANQRVGGVVIAGSDVSLPDSNPVAWRETSKKPLGTIRYLIRVLVAMEFPVAFVCAISVVDSATPTEPLSMLLFVVWVIALLLITAKSTGLVAGERSHQTLEVLLTTPMSNRQILAEKCRGPRRLMFVLWVPFLTIYGFQAWLKNSIPNFFERDDLQISSSVETHLDVEVQLTFYLVASVVTTLICLTLVSWLSCWIGMRMKTQSRAIFTTVAVLVAWCVLPLLVLKPAFGDFAPHSDVVYRSLQMLTPVSFIRWIEYHELTFKAWHALVFNSLLYGGVALILRQHCMKGAEGLLGRRDQFSSTRGFQGLFRRRPQAAAE
ncbi:MAG: ABC transporter permease subunit [Planctomycetota bacterium]|nr:ABC transporter permease subunit [Planctomycetota bacterium]